jgi:hypothetical protein
LGLGQKQIMVCFCDEQNDCDDLGAQERRALVKIGEHIDLAREVFAATSSLSVRLIWSKEIEPLTLHSAVIGAVTTPYG